MRDETLLLGLFCSSKARVINLRQNSEFTSAVRHLEYQHTANTFCAVQSFMLEGLVNKATENP